MAKFKSSKRGMSVVEAMVAVGIASLVALAGASLLVSTTKGKVKVDRIMSERSLVKEINILLNREAACTKSLDGLNPVSGAAVTGIFFDDTDPTPDYQVGTTYGITEVKVMRIQGFVELGGGDITAVDSREGLATLYIELERDDSNMAYEIPIKVGINDANQIISCQSNVNSNLWAFCDSLGGTMSASECTDWNVKGDISVEDNVFAPLIVSELHMEANRAIITQPPTPSPPPTPLAPPSGASYFGTLSAYRVEFMNNLNGRGVANARNVFSVKGNATITNKAQVRTTSELRTRTLAPQTPSLSLPPSYGAGISANGNIIWRGK